MPTYNFGAGVRSNPMDAYNEMSAMVKQSRLAKLLGGYYQNGQADLGQIAQLDPQAAQAIQKEQEQRGLAKMFADVYGMPEDQRKGGIQALLASGADFGDVSKLDPSMAAQSGMFAQKVGEDGYIYNAMRDGRMVNTGIKADRQMWFRDNPGMNPELVGKDGNTRPVGSYGQQPQGMPQAPGIQIQYDGPPEDRAAFEQLVAADAQQPFAPGNYSAQMPPQNVSPQQRQWTQNTPNPYGNAGPVFTPAQPKPAMTPAQMLAAQNAQERLRLAQGADARAQETAGMGPIPAGHRLVNGRIERIPGAPETKGSVNSVVAAKIPQLQNAIRGLGRIDEALKGLNGRFMDTGPMDAKIQRYTKAGQELEAAVGAIQNSVLALARVPGVGSQSDLEARMAALQYPSLDKDPEVNKRTVANLKLFMRDLANAYKTAVKTPQAGGGESEEGLSEEEQAELAELRARFGR